MKYAKKVDKKAINELKTLVSKDSSYKVRCRAHAILLSSKRYKIDEIADIYFVDRDTVTKWFDRWEESGVEGLRDSPRSGRPKKIVKEIE